MKHSKKSEGARFRFTIRVKLFILSLAILSIPYIGYEYMRELERYLRGSLENSLVDAARAIAAPMHESYRLFPYVQSEPEHTLFIHSLNYPIQIDGYTDDWINYIDWSDTYHSSSGTNEVNAPSTLSYKLILGRYDQYLYALLQVQDDRVIYHQPTSEQIVDSDYIEIILGDNYAVMQRYFFTPSAQGRFNPIQIEKISDDWEEKEYIRYITNIAAEWQQTDKGYNLELSLPLHMIDERMGFVVGDVDNEEDRSVQQRIGTAGTDTENHPGRLLKPSNQIEQLIKRLDTTEGRRIWVLDSQGQVLASSGSLKRESSQHPLNIFYTLILPSISERFQDDLAGASRLQGLEIMAALGGKTESRWRLSPDQKAVIVSAATPVWITDEVRGAVVVEETTNNIQMLQRHAMVSLFNKTLIIFIGITLLLLLFATRLSIRLHRLSNEASNAIDDYGRVIGTISVSESSDEIGDLSRNYAAMLDRLKQYNNYLESLAGRLSHELRTPMAVVQSSLDNLPTEIRNKDKQYLERAQEGIQRLNLLITRLSESARLEQALKSAEIETIDLCKLLTHCVEGYQLAYKSARFNLDVPQKTVVQSISADLYLQMLDKIIANAVDFSDQTEPVNIKLSESKESIKLDIINYGSILSGEMEGQLFNSMVSVRDKNKSNDPHLGLGLYIARTIAEYHGGYIKAYNLTGRKGVCFSLVFPR